VADIVLRGLGKRYGALEVVKDIDLEIADREFVVIVGPSGCGKTTTLRMIAGLESISSGELRIGGALVNDRPPRERDIAMVFQSYALFPHFSVYDNMAFGMRIRGTSKEDIDRRIRDAAQVLNLSELLDRRPKQLSGGQRQRVAMGRALVRDAKVFLFDEPLSNLDAKLRIQMRAEIRKLHQRVNTTVLYVTHDQVEAMTLADRIVVMNGGRIEQVGTPQELYDRPRTQFVAGFIGSPAMNFVPCRLQAVGDRLECAVMGGRVHLPLPADRHPSLGAYAGRELTLGIRPEHLTEARAHAAPHQFDFQARVEFLEPMGNDTMAYLDFDGVLVCGRSTPRGTKPAGSEMPLTIDMDAAHLIDPETGRVLTTAPSAG
jgi:multiple sugar transport system ATP-binding protein